MPAPKPVPTYGLTHIALAVGDVERAFALYARVFGMVAVYRGDGFLQAQTPGSRDVLVFEKSDKRGQDRRRQAFRLPPRRPGRYRKGGGGDRKAGGTILDKGAFVPGEPYLFFKDLDGYEVEVWYEIPTPVDPPPKARQK